MMMKRQHRQALEMARSAPARRMLNRSGVAKRPRSQCGPRVGRNRSGQLR